MKRKFLKAMACAMSVCMLSMSLAGCGDDSNESSTPNSGTPGSSTPDSSTPESSETGSGDDSQQAEDDVYVNPNGDLYPAYDFGGITLTVLDHNDLGGRNPDAEHLVNMEDIENSDKTEEEKTAEIEKRTYEREQRQKKKDYIEQKYNVHLEFVPLPTNDWDSIAEEIVQAYISGNPVADIMDVYFNFMATYVSNGILYDYTDDLAKADQFKHNGYLEWNGKTWGIARGIGGEGIYYNKDMIKSLGMEYTPAEMFDMGKWSYADCRAYLEELKSYMGADEYPIFVSPGYWFLFAPHANGVKILDDSGNLNYLADPMLECMEFYAGLVNDGLNAVPAYTKDDGTTGYNNWGYAGETFDKGHTVAMSHRGAWQADGIVQSADTDFEVGFVPYPWGSNVTIDASAVGQPGAYKTLSDNYWASYYDGQLLAVTKGTEKKADPVQVMSMVLEWMGWDSDMAAYQQDEETKGVGWLEEGIDTEVYLYCQDRQRLATYNSIDLEFTLGQNMSSTFYTGGSIRSYFESCYSQDMAMMIDRGFATEDVMTPVEGAEDDAAE